MRADLEAQAAAAEAAKIPPGMRMMPESERLETLDILAQNQSGSGSKDHAASIQY